MTDVTENRGQADSEVKYVAVGSRYKANLTNDGILAPLSPKPLRIRKVGRWYVAEVAGLVQIEPCRC